MAWCENQNCNRVGLTKSEVEFDDERRMLLCQTCFASAHPGWVPPVVVVDMRQPQSTGTRFDYEVKLSRQEGFSAKVSYGDLRLAFHAPMGELKRYLGVE